MFTGVCLLPGDCKGDRKTGNGGLLTCFQLMNLTNIFFNYFDIILFFMTVRI